MNKPKLTNPNGVTFATTDSMYPMAKSALDTLYERGVQEITLHKIDFTYFACGEVKPKIINNVRHKDVFLFYDFNNQPNEDLMNLLLTIDALHFADARRITLVLPYIPYLRQDRKDEPRTPLSAAMVIRMLQSWDSVKRVITIDMHSEQLQSAFTIPTDHLPGSMLFVPWAKQYYAGQYDSLVAVAPDFGSAKRVRKLAEAIDHDLPVAILEKKRDKNGVDILGTIGASVAGKSCLINDDMMDTCGTIIKAANALYAQGATEVVLSATHAIFSDKDGTSAYDKLGAAKVTVVVSDSIITEKHPWLTVLPLGELMGLTILQNITSDGSVSRLIENGL